MEDIVIQAAMVTLQTMVATDKVECLETGSTLNLMTKDRKGE